VPRHWPCATALSHRLCSVASRRTTGGRRCGVARRTSKFDGLISGRLVPFPRTLARGMFHGCNGIMHEANSRIMPRWLRSDPGARWCAPRMSDGYTVVACTPPKSELQRTGIIRQRLASPPATVHLPFDLLAASAYRSRGIDRCFQFHRGNRKQSASTL
jgi:hypothetical protein